MDKSVKYVAYGHNCNIEQFKNRIPGAKLIGTAILPGWKFELKHFANITKDANNEVQCVLWSIPHSSLKMLDKDEDYHIHYDRTEVEVEYDGKFISALTYVMTKKYRSEELPTKKELPTAKYVKWIAKGYRENHISIAQLISALETRIAEEKIKHESRIK